MNFVSSCPKSLDRLDCSSLDIFLLIYYHGSFYYLVDKKKSYYFTKIMTVGSHQVERCLSKGKNFKKYLKRQEIKILQSSHVALLYEVFFSAQPASGGFFVVSLFMQKGPLAFFFYHTPDLRGERKKGKRKRKNGPDGRDEGIAMGSMINSQASPLL